MTTAEATSRTADDPSATRREGSGKAAAAVTILELEVEAAA